MNFTDYHAKYFAYELTKCCSSDSPAPSGVRLDRIPLTLKLMDSLRSV